MIITDNPDAYAKAVAQYGELFVMMRVTLIENGDNEMG